MGDQLTKIVILGEIRSRWYRAGKRKKLLQVVRLQQYLTFQMADKRLVNRVVGYAASSYLKHR